MFWVLERGVSLLLFSYFPNIQFKKMVERISRSDSKELIHLFLKVIETVDMLHEDGLKSSGCLPVPIINVWSLLHKYVHATKPKLQRNIFTDGQKKRYNRILSGYTCVSRTRAARAYHDQNPILLSNLSNILHVAFLLPVSIFYMQWFLCSCC